MGRKAETLKKLAETDFFSLAKIEKHPRTRIRLLALGHVKQGKLRNEIAEMFCVTTQAIREWVNRFISNGLHGLQEGFRSGRRKKLQTSQEEEFRCQVEKLQQELKGGRIRASDIQVILREKFSVDYALPSIYHLLERTQMHWLTARSKHPKADKEAQEDFKKTLEKK
jgi:transposase